MNVSLEILKMLSNYISNKIDLQSFRDWQVDLFLGDAKREFDDNNFLSIFDGHYAELSDGLISEPQFKQLLSALVAPMEAGTAQASPSILIYGANNPEPATVLQKPAYSTHNASVIIVEPEYSLA